MGNQKASPSPSPQAQASQPTTTVSLPMGINIQVPSGGGSSTSSLYGLGGWAAQTIDVTGFPSQVAVPLIQALQQAGVDTTGPIKAEDVAKALSSLKDTQAVARLQQLLFYSGFYTSGTQLNDLQLGSFGDKDVAALKNAVITAGQTSQQLGAYLSVRANTGMAQGMVNQAAGVGVKPIVQPSPSDLDAALRTAAHNILGHEPSAADLAGFRAVYDQAYTDGQRQANALAGNQTANGLPSADELGGAIGRLGLGLTDQSETPPATLYPHNLPASQGRNPDFTGPNPALPTFQAQYQQDQNTYNQYANAANQNGVSPVLTDAANPENAAEDYLRQHDAAQVAQQNLATKYQTLLSILGGSG